MRENSIKGRARYEGNNQKRFRIADKEIFVFSIVSRKLRTSSHLVSAVDLTLARVPSWKCSTFGLCFNNARNEDDEKSATECTFYGTWKAKNLFQNFSYRFGRRISAKTCRNLRHCSLATKAEQAFRCREIRSCCSVTLFIPIFVTVMGCVRSTNTVLWIWIDFPSSE